MYVLQLVSREIDKFSIEIYSFLWFASILSLIFLIVVWYLMHIFMDDCSNICIMEYLGSWMCEKEHSDGCSVFGKGKL